MKLAAIDEKQSYYLKQGYKVSIGVESGCQTMLDYLNKGYRAEELPEKVHILKKYNIQVQAFVMIGLPHETDEQRRKTFAVTMDLPFDHVTYNIYTPYPGTELYYELLKTGILDNKKYNLKSYSRTDTDNRLTKRSPTFLRWCAIFYFLRFLKTSSSKGLSKSYHFPDDGCFAFYKYNAN
jgi:radical SAM superfamily enzyme YgiQ (UPF0313 family)